MASTRYSLTAPSQSSLVLRRAGAGYEVEVTSPKGFPLRAVDPSLLVGSQRLDVTYRSPPNGSIYTLIFVLTAAEFGSLTDGALVSVAYGSSRSAIDIGTLAKSTVGGP